MKNTGKWIAVAGGILLSLALIALIVNEMTPKTEQDVPNVAVGTPDAPDVEVEPIIPENQPEVSPEPIEVEPTDPPELTNGDDKGEEQTIQPEPEPMPEYTDEQLSDPTQTPDGEPVTPPTEENPTPPQTEESPTQPTQPVNPSGGLPGFDNVPNMGDNIVTHADDMYENGNKVGIMD